jgi:hypothetical protein
MSNTNGSTSKGNGNTSKSNGTTDGKGGVAFGTSVVYTDAYNNDMGDDEFVTSLPTAEEEAMMEDGVKAREEEEMLDEGRVGGFHPSTLANQSVRFHGRIEYRMYTSFSF